MDQCAPIVFVIFPKISVWIGSENAPCLDDVTANEDTFEDECLNINCNKINKLNESTNDEVIQSQEKIYLEKTTSKTFSGKGSCTNYVDRILGNFNTHPHPM